MHSVVFESVPQLYVWKLQYVGYGKCDLWLLASCQLNITLVGCDTVLMPSCFSKI